MSSESESIQLEPPPPVTAWFFHDSPLQLEDPNAALPVSSSAVTATATPPPTSSNKDKSPTPVNLDSSSSSSKDNKIPPSLGIDIEQQSILGSYTPVYSVTSSIVGTISPNINWQAFSPYDNTALENSAGIKFRELEIGINDENDLDEEISDDNKNSTVVVGVNRLYQVSLDWMKLMPIYWPPFNHPANVHRATWFFSSSLTPIELNLEEAIEAAFQDIKPWTSAYLNELESAIDVPEALTKLRIPLTYSDGKASIKVEVVFAPSYRRDDSSIPDELENDDPEADEEEDSDDTQMKDTSDDKTGPLDTAAAVGIADTAPTINETVTPRKQFPVAYIFSIASTLSFPLLSSTPTPAQLISCLLSGRTPPGTLFTVQRHFCWTDWKKIRTLPDRTTDEIDYKPQKVTQLVLVLHGIGQKLTERMESFNFTYAINSFRIQVSSFLNTPALRQYIEPGANILTLPINWRRTLNFEDLKDSKRRSSYGSDSDIDDDDDDDAFTLNDITVKSIPTVRNLISDVMLDIPYYMSHHKPKLLNAAVREANRIYSLFIKHNPEFIQLGGKVNLIGHSLGSTIAVDLLSSQPTDVTECTRDQLENGRIFKFNVHNLFMVGSPVAFFLLLENAKLYPRELYERKKGKKLGKNVTYPYGCIAVRNIYNILHYSDPISYYLGPTADRYQASLLELATLPGEKAFPLPGSEVISNSGFFNALTSRLPFLSERSPTPRTSSSTLNGQQENPQEQSISDKESPTIPDASTTIDTENDIAKYANDSAVVSSAVIEGIMEIDEKEEEEEDQDHQLTKPGESVELETRNFEKELLGEEKLSLLNENGQIDWIIPLTGTLETLSQYVSMITAHSSYWDAKDFARMVAIECGRPSGINHTLNQYRAKKKVNF